MITFADGDDSVETIANAGKSRQCRHCTPPDQLPSDLYVRWRLAKRFERAPESENGESCRQEAKETHEASDWRWCCWYSCVHHSLTERRESGFGALAAIACIHLVGTPFSYREA